MSKRTGTPMVVAGALALGLLPQGASAQGMDSRWTAWTGCWQAEAPVTDAMAMPAAGPTVCVVPAAAGSVEIVTVVDGKVAGRETLTANGSQTPVTRESCTGFTTADWSADGRRIFRRAEYSCPGGFDRKSTGMIAMSSTGEWIDVEGLAVGSQEAVRVLRYRPLGSLAGIPAEVSAALEGRSFTTSTARMAAASDMSTAEVVEASKRVGAGVVEAWLAERGQGFALELDARRLVQLAEAGVSPRAIDMMVALSYPERFAINRAGNPQVRPDDRSASRDSDAFGRDPWAFGYGYPGYLGYGYGYGYDRFGYDRYGYGYDRYGYGSYYSRPVIIVRGSDDEVSRPAARGRMVNGRGYTGGDNSGSTSQPAPRPANDTGSSSSGSSGGSSSSGSSGGSAPRTAQPR